MRSSPSCFSLCLAVFGGITFTVLAAGSPPLTQSRPSYTEQGLLEFPRRFRSWVFVGADLSVRYKSEEEKASTESDDSRNQPPDAFHVVYINPESYQAYLKTGQFPDPTILVMEVFQAEEKQKGGIIAGGKYQGKRIELAAAVKDSHRPGGGVPWAYYTFELDQKSGPVKPAKAFPDAQCYDCHRKHARKDNVWVQFYPALRDPG